MNEAKVNPQWEKVIACTYPGQTEDVRIGIGKHMMVMFEGAEYPNQYDVTWCDAPYPQETHTLEAFLQAYPPKPGGGIERFAKERGVL